MLEARRSRRRSARAARASLGLPGRSSQRPAFAAAATISRRPSPSTSPAVRQRHSVSGRTAIVSPAVGGRARAVAADLDGAAAHRLDRGVELVLAVAVEVGDQDLLGVAVAEIGDHLCDPRRASARSGRRRPAAACRRAGWAGSASRRSRGRRRRRGRRPRSRARRCRARGRAPSRRSRPRRRDAPAPRRPGRGCPRPRSARRRRGRRRPRRRACGRSCPRSRPSRAPCGSVAGPPQLERGRGAADAQQAALAGPRAVLEQLVEDVALGVAQRAVAPGLPARGEEAGGGFAGDLAAGGVLREDREAEGEHSPSRGRGGSHEAQRGYEDEDEHGDDAAHEAPPFRFTPGGGAPRRPGPGTGVGAAERVHPAGGAALGRPVPKGSDHSCSHASQRNRRSPTNATGPPPMRSARPWTSASATFRRAASTTRANVGRETPIRAAAASW